jgi:hypothetical protein
MAISEQELNQIYRNLGSTASVVSSAVARLYLASPDPRLSPSDPSSLLSSYPTLSENQWTYSHVYGGLVFVIDRAHQTCLFQIYDLENFSLRFEYELYYDIEYVALDSMFHSFEMEGCVAGFSFSSENDAVMFDSKVKALLPSSSASAPMNVLGSMAVTPYGSAMAGSIFGGGKKKAGFAGKLFGSFANLTGASHSKETNNGSNRAMEISPVLAVSHNEHVGLNADGTFVMENLTDDWKRFFKGAGIRKKDLRDPAFVQTIRGVMTEQGISLQEPPRNVPREQLSVAYTPEQMRAYDVYMQELAEYEEALAEYEKQMEEEANLVKMAQWEKENAAIIESNKIKNATIPREKRPQAPPMPPRETAKAKHTPHHDNNNLSAHSERTGGGGRFDHSLKPQGNGSSNIGGRSGGERRRPADGQSKRPERSRSPGGGGGGRRDVSGRKNGGTERKTSAQKLGEHRPSDGRIDRKPSGRDRHRGGHHGHKGERPAIPGKPHRKRRPREDGERKHRGPRAPVPPALPPLKSGASSGSNKSGESHQRRRNPPTSVMPALEENSTANHAAKGSQSNMSQSENGRSGRGNNSPPRKKGSSSSQSPSPSSRQKLHAKGSGGGRSLQSKPPSKRNSMGRSVAGAVRRSLTRPSGRGRGRGRGRGGGRGGGGRSQQDLSEASMKEGRGRAIVPPAPATPAVVKPPMPAFLQAIQAGAGAGLKAPRQSILPKFTSVKPEKQDGIIDALRVAMQKRRPMLESSTQVGSDSDDSDWSIGSFD